MKGGALNYLPLPAEVTDVASLASNIGFVSITGHGELTGNVFTIPENTYVMFLGGAGHPIERRPYQIPDLQRYRFLQPGETPKDWYTRTYDAIKSREFFKQRLYRAETPYADKHVSIYEPGDIVQDIHLQLENQSHPFLLLGVWSCPLPAELSREFDRINEELETYKHEKYAIQDNIEAAYKRMRRGETVSEIEVATLVSARDNANAQIAKLTKEGEDLQTSFISNPQNHAYKIGLTDMTNTSLYEIIHKLGNTQMWKRDRPIKCLVVEACRSMPSFSMNLGEFIVDAEVNGRNKALIEKHKRYEQDARLRRRFSLMARRVESNPELGLINPVFRYNMENLIKIQSMAPTAEIINIIGMLSSKLPVPIKAIEDAFNQYADTSRALIDADVRNIESKLPPHKRFKPGDCVKLEDDSTGIVLGLKDEKGYVMINVISASDAGVQFGLQNPHSLTLQTDEAQKELLQANLLSYDVDVDALIAKEQADVALTHTSIQRAHAWWSDQLVRNPAILTEWSKLNPALQFKPGDRVMIGETSPVKIAGQEISLTGKYGIVKNIEITPPTHPTVPNQLFYKLGINGIEKNIPRRPNVLTLEGGARNSRSRKGRRQVRRKQTRRRR